MDSMNKNFLGESGFIWFFGIVENRQDPLGLGRVQVRVYGTHSQSLQDIPTINLPWASVVHATNDRMFATPREDDMVFGFWADSASKQFPIVIGIVPGYFTNPNNQGQGFNDLRSNATLVNSPKRLISRTYNTNGSGIILIEANTANPAVLATFRHPTPDEQGHESITGISRYQNLANTVIQARKNNLDKNILTANNTQWSEPYPAYNPLYPYNQVIETESGHVFELDDTPGSERIQIAHRSGSFVEWYPTGSKVEKVTKSAYSIVMGDDHIHVMGRVMITVGNDALIKVGGNVILEGGGKMTANIAGDVDFSVGGNMNFAAKNMNFAACNDITLISQTQHLTPSTSLDVSTEALSLTGTNDVNIDSGGSMSISASGDMSVGQIAMTPASISLTSPVLNTTELSDTIIPIGSVTAATKASPGTATGLPSAIGASTSSYNAPSPEQVPIPIPGPFAPAFDPYTGTAFAQSQFLVSNGSGGTTTPDANAAANVANCSYNANAHTFLSDPTTWQISQNGLQLIKSFEGYAKVVSGGQVTAYPDPATGGEPLTIGYGTTAVAIGQPITLGMLISMATALEYLNEGITNQYLPALTQNVTVPLTQNMIDACLSLIYNIGGGNFLKSSVLSNINQQNWCAAANAFLLWNKAAGRVLPALTSRRTQERALFLS
jgi:lysozyme